MNQAALDMLRQIFDALSPGSIRQEAAPVAGLALDIPSQWCREELNGARMHLSVLASCILHGTESQDVTHKDAQRICDFLGKNVKVALDEAGVGRGDGMDWPHVRAELLATLKSVINALEEGPQVITPVPRSAQAVAMFDLDGRANADFLKPQIADARAFAKSPHGGYPDEDAVKFPAAKGEPATLGRTVAQG